MSVVHNFLEGHLDFVENRLSFEHIHSELGPECFDNRDLVDQDPHFLEELIDNFLVFLLLDLLSLVDEVGLQILQLFQEAHGLTLGHFNVEESAVGVGLCGHQLLIEVRNNFLVVLHQGLQAESVDSGGLCKSGILVEVDRVVVYLKGLPEGDSRGSGGFPGQQQHQGHSCN